MTNESENLEDATTSLTKQLNNCRTLYARSNEGFYSTPIISQPIKVVPGKLHWYMIVVKRLLSYTFRVAAAWGIEEDFKAAKNGTLEVYIRSLIGRQCRRLMQSMRIWSLALVHVL